jgi:hypothetical protein
MRSFRKRAQWLVGGLAFWMMLAGWMAAQEDVYAAPRGLPSTEDCWPPPCRPMSCDPCDRLKSRCPNPCDAILTPPRLPWYATIDGAAIRRDPFRAVDFAALDSPTSIVLSTREIGYDFSGAARCLVGHTFNECLQIEGVYMAVTEDEGMAAVRDSSDNELGGLGNLASPFGGFGLNPIAGLDYNNLAQIRYVSSLQSAELNVRRQLPMRADRLTTSILFGVRYIALPEQFDYYTESAVPMPNGAINSIHVATDNEMVGPQIGALFEFYAENRWWVNFEMKAALMNNLAKQSTAYQNVDSQGVIRDFLGSRRENHTSFAGELALTFVYRWSPNLTTRVGYQALWLENVALAPDNLNTDIDVLTQNPAQLYHDAGTVYHGPYAGITLGW